MDLEARKLYSLEEFEALAAAPEHADRLLELIDGEISEKMPTQEHGLIALIIGAALLAYARQTKSGRVGTEVRHRLAGDARYSLLPDVSYVLGGETLVRSGSVSRMPDLAVEILSPDDDLRKTRDKIRYYLANGTRLAWLVIPEKQIVEVYTPEADSVLVAADTLDGGDVLPGFSLPVADIFSDPTA